MMTPWKWDLFSPNLFRVVTATVLCLTLRTRRHIVPRLIFMVEEAESCFRSVPDPSLYREPRFFRIHC